MLLYVATWFSMLNDGKKVGVYRSDASGAFDKLSTTRLLETIVSLGLHRDLFGIVQRWLRDRKAFVGVAGDRFGVDHVKHCVSRHGVRANAVKCIRCRCVMCFLVRLFLHHYICGRFECV